MSNILFGLALISASLQTSWALFAEDHLLALPVAGMVLLVGWQCLTGGSGRNARPVLRTLLQAADTPADR